MSASARTWPGWSIVAVGVLHCAVGLVVFGTALSAMIGDGLWSSVDGSPGRPIAFWFMMAGLLMITFGLATVSIQQADVPISKRMAALFGLIVVVAVIAMPKSGAWLPVPAAGTIAWDAFRAK